MELEGRIKLIGETQTFGSNGFKKRELVVTTDGEYPQHILVEFTQDKADVLDGYNIGDLVTININLRGREWTNPQGETKYFNSIQGWRIAKLGAGDGEAPEAATPQEAFGEDNDDLPF